jgi:hypothetical protein
LRIGELRMGSDVKRREAIKEYKARKPLRGAFAMRCCATGQVWVGSSMNLDATRNGLWFALDHGGHRDETLQAAWIAHGEQGFRYEILEKLDDDVPPIVVRDLLKEKKAHWVAQFGARALL